jgi:uncharacterized protein YjbJ (UPF0337 family)
MMKTALHFHSSWESLKEKIKETNTSLTDEDLQYSPGKEEELCGRLADKLHMNKDEVTGWLESLDSNKAMAG